MAQPQQQNVIALLQFVLAAVSGPPTEDENEREIGKPAPPIDLPERTVEENERMRRDTEDRNRNRDRHYHGWRLRDDEHDIM